MWWVQTQLKTSLGNILTERGIAYENDFEKELLNFQKAILVGDIIAELEAAQVQNLIDKLSPVETVQDLLSTCFFEAQILLNIHAELILGKQEAFYESFKLAYKFFQRTCVIFENTQIPKPKNFGVNGRQDIHSQR